MDEHTNIFGLGLSRTGTASLTKALKILGIKTKHFPNDKTTQKQLKQGEYNLSILNDYQALTDIPTAPYYSQLDKTYPECKFILTTRPMDSWLKSVQHHFDFYVKNMRDEFDNFVFASVFGILEFNAERFQYVYELHEINVRSYFANKPEKLLILNFFEGDGWEKLCSFLNLPIPKNTLPTLQQEATKTSLSF